ncbi:glycoside hydrolase family 13 protein [Roridomyces roridus]|uniref:Glycoside hydrolase family 13 protein n=1 Tax=Roridomyces roridus TaxID=1738132 RepID=A0AAD7CIY5_9AGAR|nr:glycoside hydrolase family 13 protein [Roridomyces roridus]
MRLGPEGNPDNPLMLQFFTWDALHSELSWWKHLELEIPKLAAMGVTQLWLPPPNKGANQKGRGYDAYDLWDLGEFEQKGTVRTRWGTREELLQACRVATEHGVDIIVDAVLNHKLGADRYEAFPAVPVILKIGLKMRGWTAFDFKGRGTKYSKFRWTHEHFTGLDWDHRTRTKAIYRIAGPGRKGWSRNVDKELGNYDYLLGIDIIGIRVWILETTGARAFRYDAIKHFDQNFLLRFITHVRKQSGMPGMFSVSEYWSGDLDRILPYIKAFRGQTAFFDVPLHTNFHNASKSGSRYDLRSILDKTIVKKRPGDAVTFVDNHDTVVGQSLESWVDTNFKIQAYSLILLRKDGHPCIFYGDLYPNDECYDETIAQSLKVLIEARKRFAYGVCEDYPQDRNCVGFVRKGDTLHPGCVVVLSNKDEADGVVHTVRMRVGKEHAGSSWESFMTPGERVEIDADGWGRFSCLPNRVQVWIRASE